jgi:hypothetical protein
MLSSGVACGSLALIASSRFLCPSRSVWSSTCELPRDSRVLGLGFSCGIDVLCEIPSGAPRPRRILYRGTPGRRGGACLPFVSPFEPVLRFD